ncbi:MAG: hypothetical protein IPM45_00405 [Acidimicrobiales bacterium]|nr:hypothetical protein [Acidimicrobiales bacterium]
MRSVRVRRGVLVVLLTALVAAGAACGDDDASVDATTSAPTTAAAPTDVTVGADVERLFDEQRSVAGVLAWQDVTDEVPADLRTAASPAGLVTPGAVVDALVAAGVITVTTEEGSAPPAVAVALDPTDAGRELFVVWVRTGGDDSIAGADYVVTATKPADEGGSYGVDELLSRTACGRGVTDDGTLCT